MNALEHRGESGGSARQGKGAVMWICGRVLRTGASPAGRVDKPVDNADALPTASPTLSRLSPTSSTGPTTSDSKRLPLTALRFNICIPLNPIPTSPTRWLTLSRSGSFPYGIRLQVHSLLRPRIARRHLWTLGFTGGGLRKDAPGLHYPPLDYDDRKGETMTDHSNNSQSQEHKQVRQLRETAKNPDEYTIEKSQAANVILVLLLGPIGLFYASPMVATAVVVSVFILVLMLIGLLASGSLAMINIFDLYMNIFILSIVLWLGCLIHGCQSVNKHNRTVAAIREAREQERHKEYLAAIEKSKTGT